MLFVLCILPPLSLLTFVSRSTVIEDLELECTNNPKTCVAYFYFSHQHHDLQKPSDLLVSLIDQLAFRTPATVTVVNSLLSMRQTDKERPSVNKCLDALKNILRLSGKVYIAIDALDESSEWLGFERILRTIYKWSLPNVQLLLTSGKQTQIEQALMEFCVAIDLESSIINPDKLLYVDDTFERGEIASKLKHCGQDQKKLCVALSSNAGGL
jgi:hypothetical protein